MDQLPPELLQKILAGAGCQGALQCARVCKGWDACVRSNAEPWRSWLRAEKSLVADPGSTPYDTYRRYRIDDRLARAGWEEARPGRPSAMSAQDKAWAEEWDRARRAREKLGGPPGLLSLLVARTG